MVVTYGSPVNSLIDSESLCSSIVSLGEIIPLCDERGALSPQEHSFSPSPPPPHPSQPRVEAALTELAGRWNGAAIGMCFSKHALPPHKAFVAIVKCCKERREAGRSGNSSYSWTAWEEFTLDSDWKLV